MALPANYHRDWQRSRAADDPEWYERRKESRSDARRQKKSKAVASRGGVCAKCLGSFPDYVFEFHHVVPEEKEHTPSKLFMLSDSKIEQELAKCVMVCSNCHKIIHHEDNYSAHSKRYVKHEE